MSKSPWMESEQSNQPRSRRRSSSKRAALTLEDAGNDPQWPGQQAHDPVELDSDWMTSTDVMEAMDGRR